MPDCIHQDGQRRAWPRGLRSLLLSLPLCCFYWRVGTGQYKHGGSLGAWRARSHPLLWKYTQLLRASGLVAPAPASLWQGRPSSLELKVFKKMLARGACLSSSDRSPTSCLAIAQLLVHNDDLCYCWSALDLVSSDFFHTSGTPWYI
jgi:hypothetical protein